MSPTLTRADLHELDTLNRQWDPYSGRPELWHGCPGHEWARLDYNGVLVTRCERCGAPRCGRYHHDLPAGEFGRIDDRLQQRYRCTLERHHGEAHDFLDGSRVEVGR